jgi:hypothetical protein
LRSAVLVALALACAHPAPPPEVPPATPDALNPQKIAGPYGSLDDWCKDRTKRERAILDSWEIGSDLRQERSGQIKCHLDGVVAEDHHAHGGAWGEVRVVGIEAAAQMAPPARQCNVAMRVGASWFVVEDVVRCHADLYSHEIHHASLDHLELDGNRLVVVMAEHDNLAWGPRVSQYLVVCGVGHSGRASCTPRVLVDTSGADGGDRAKLAWVFGHDVLALDGAIGDADDRRQVHERHRIYFP